MEPLNIPFIQKRIKEAHSNFIDTVGGMPNKITADHQLLLNRMATRIETIIECFKEEKIIDKFQKINSGIAEENRSCFVFELTKNGFDKSVFVWTDGIHITIKTSHYPIFSGLDIEDDITIKDIDFESYNWVEFSDKLLNFIHKVIYERMKSIEAKMFSLKS